MTIEEKRKKFLNMCHKHRCNQKCPCSTYNSSFCTDITRRFTGNVDEWDEATLDHGIALLEKGIVNKTVDSVNDPVNHPSHYTKGKIEVADFIADQKLNFDRGNAVKYICRAGAKDPKKEVEDLEKAIWYIKHEIKALKGEVENA